MALASILYTCVKKKKKLAAEMLTVNKVAE